ncbi:ATP-binding protein [Entomobacter blattae]|uniref:histidine kinase n=1 Tax=Entomobacter blattae TaxID=2762277 RepID=A0A7H1NST3_9PROT|nr:ATP-binding protein [Entomobacter blattae]QNT78843.1 Osmolarity sensor protein EnvZ [Entomobacter blattae]
MVPYFHRILNKNWDQSLERFIRRILPRSFLGRSLLIILIPLVVIQLISLSLYYGSYYHTVSRRLTDGIAGEIRVVVENYHHIGATATHPVNPALQSSIEQVWLMQVKFYPHRRLETRSARYVLGPIDEDLDKALKTFLSYPFHTDWNTDPENITVWVQLPTGLLSITFPRKRLDIGSVWMFVFWQSIGFIILFFLAVIFTRNQVRAIRRLAKAAENFGLGRDYGPVRPQGAKEVRRLAVAFNRMRERILNFVTQRTAVLAGVSHDLRTPLTRMRLSLAIIPQKGSIDAKTLQEEISDMVTDIEEMERMIEGYLTFARGEGLELPKEIDMKKLLEEVVLSARRSGAKILRSTVSEVKPIIVRKEAIRRVLNNVITNAYRHGGEIVIELKSSAKGVVILCDDNGPGIPPDQRESAFGAFESGKNGGTGLGLTISRDIIRAHGGEITLGTSTMGGLRVYLFLPY